MGNPTGTLSSVPSVPYKGSIASPKSPTSQPNTRKAPLPQIDTSGTSYTQPSPASVPRIRSPLSQSANFDSFIQEDSSSNQPNYNYSIPRNNGQQPIFALANSDNSSSSADSVSQQNRLLPSKMGHGGANISTSEVSSMYDHYPSNSPSYNQFASPSSPRARHQSKLSDAFSDSTNSPRRILSEKARQTPSSFVRQSRHFSNDFSDTDANSLNSITGQSLLLQNKLQTENLSPEFRPIVNLLNAQRLRTYRVGSFQIPARLGNDHAWFEVDAKLTGTELAIWRPSDDEYTMEDGNDEFKPRYINLVDFRLEFLGDLRLRISQDYREDSSVVIRFHNEIDFIKWISAMMLSKYEYTKLNEAFTAVLLSSKGSKLSDIHVLLTHKKRFIEHEWCNIRLPEISTKWIKVYMVILPSDKHHLGRIEFYPSDKKMQKKHLIAYLSDLTSLFNVYPGQSNMIDFNSIMRASGQIFVNKHYEYLFPYNSHEDHHSSPRKLIAKNHASISRSGSNKSLASLTENNNNNTSNNLQIPSTPKPNGDSRSRSDSLNSASSFFANSPSMTATPLTRDRSVSNASNSDKSSKIFKSKGGKSHTEFDLNRTNSSFFKKHADDFASTSSMYIMPIPHPGVNAVETMVRNFIPIIDSFKLYGRPRHLASEKTNPDSMLFGLPSLPHYQYLSTRDAQDAFAQYFKLNMNQFQMEDILRDKILALMQSGGRHGRGYRGHGDVSKLYEGLDVNFDEMMSPDLSGVGSINGGRGGTGADILSLNLDDGISLESPRVTSPLSV
ncbi:hypothetical protein KGF57_003292 [Candida theae]|uniref:Skg3/CAF120-like PH-like domain-containing protein n=1 Tax=Candida theae TaxID=1198502 RepID=A0AAD5BDX0_9ASCO|nr:uncharacterized protein KGF57_003292 [Candida theae]KAI5957598.1 hypothetical protein KGF57_003292 [Candida theae]